MELWFTERHTNGVNFSIKVDCQLFSGQSEFQKIDIFDSKEFGRFLALDGYMMLTEKDEFIYHEMIVHVPMAVHPEVKKVLVIGAGDGGVIRELCRYETIEKIDMVEIDELVVEVPYHTDIMERFNGIDMDAAGKVAGNGFEHGAHLFGGGQHEGAIAR